MLVYEWLIAPFLEFPFLRRALVAAIMIALSSGLVGALMMLNRMSLVGDALSQG
ncbi:MAG: metal ABC transporter permease, partial [Xanthomonadaceae bacterium]|nr:metal ABC transporter permease [Xanthomonadaceae bacterium]